MSGTLIIKGKNAQTIEWDTDRPASYEAAKAAYNQAIMSGGQAFNSSGAEATRIDGGPLPTEVEEVTIVPRIAGG